mmetsp:Transcript_1788/g.4026  ORF Transcript_1788/g.4026 Transcript_1788/m.4026 type:complete len:85 (+) Transcript_1788:404-658(+)
MDKLADEYGDKVIFICVNTRGVPDILQYKRQKGLKSPKLVHGAARPPAEYGLKYIPHKVVIDKNGKIKKNFDNINLKADVKEVL